MRLNEEIPQNVVFSSVLSGVKSETRSENKKGRNRPNIKHKNLNLFRFQNGTSFAPVWVCKCVRCVVLEVRLYFPADCGFVLKLKVSSEEAVSAVCWWCVGRVECHKLEAKKEHTSRTQRKEQQLDDDDGGVAQINQFVKS